MSYLCAKHGSSVSYRSAAQIVADMTGLITLCHATVRKETLRCGENIEDSQFQVGWFAGGRKRHGAKHLRVSIDGTVVTATPRDETSKFEVVAGRVERDGVMGRRFVCAVPRRSLARVLVAAALEQSGWTADTVVDVVTDGASPRLRELKQRHLFVPRGMKVPGEISSVCQASIDTALIEAHWDSLVHLAASVRSGHASAVTALARFGSAARGDPIYDAGVQLGKLLRTAFLSDYFVNASFRRELRRVLNRGEAVNALKRAIYTGRVAPAQARRADEMQAVADALSLLANVVMAWNTAQMQAVLDRWSNRRQIVPPELLGRIAPTRLEGINLRGVFRFPLERYAGQLMPSQTAAKTSASA